MKCWGMERILPHPSHRRKRSWILWDELLKEYDEIVHIPMSSGLSGTCDTAKMLAADYEDRVWVVDNHRISVTQRQSTLDAIALAQKGIQREADPRYFNAGPAWNPVFILWWIRLRYLKEGRPDHPGGSGTRYAAPVKAGASDPGKEAGCFC